MFNFRNKHNLEKNTQRKGGISMDIEDMEQTLEFLKNIKDFFYNVDEVEKKLKAELYGKEGEKEDYVHEWELSEMNVAEIMKWYKSREKKFKRKKNFKGQARFNKYYKTICK